MRALGYLGLVEKRAAADAHDARWDGIREATDSYDASVLVNMWQLMLLMRAGLRLVPLTKPMCISSSRYMCDSPCVVLSTS